MEHQAYINKFCRLCNCEMNTSTKKVNVKKCVKELNFFYDEDFGKDNPACQSIFICGRCLKSIEKIKKHMSFKVKNPNSHALLQCTLPPYCENVKIHLLEMCRCATETEDTVEGHEEEVDVPNDATEHAVECNEEEADVLNDAYLEENEVLDHSDLQGNNDLDDTR